MELSSEEQLYDNAMSVVTGYQQPRLGRNQEYRLCDMREHGAGHWGNNSFNRRLMASLERRKLVEQSGPTPYHWKLTELGLEVARILQDEVINEP